MNAFKDVNPEVVFIADYCGEREEEMIKQLIPFKYSFIPTALGINDTCLLQYEMAFKQTEHQEILFLECDYIWNDIPYIGEKFVEGIRQLGLVSPYDHLNFYIDQKLHSSVCEIKLVGSQHWRSTERNTMTFGVRSGVFKENYEIFKKYGYLDADVWYELLDQSWPLYVPIPSMATHMVKDWLAPSVQWEELWTTLI